MMEFPEYSARKASQRTEKSGGRSSRSSSPIAVPRSLPTGAGEGDPFLAQPLSASASGSGSGFRSNGRAATRRQRTNSSSSRGVERLFIPSTIDSQIGTAPGTGKHSGAPMQRFVSNTSLGSKYFREGTGSSVLQSTFEETAAVAAAASQDSTPLRRYVRFMARERKGTRDLMLVGIIAAGWIRWAVGTGGWSGRGVPPKFGDFEAQRHWIEIATHLPYSQWYFYDLEYWGLDYPPLSGWLSLWCGKLAQHFPSLHAGFALDTSRGYEAQPLPSYMRLTVLACDALVYIPAVLFFISRRLRGSGRGTRTRSIAQLSVLFQPALILIDHGHFQYNCVMLGLSAGAFALLSTNLPNPDGPGFGLLPAGKRPEPTATAATTDGATSVSTRSVKRRLTNLSRRLSYDYVAAAILFSLSLSFKQMALYYAPAVFAIMLGRCWGLAAHVGFDRGLALFSGLAIFTTLTFGLVFHPWLTSLQQFQQVVHRIFPLARGIFEDKVANVWCFLSVLPIIPRSLRPKELMSVQALARLSMVTTVLLIIPSCVHLFWAGVETVRVEMEVDEVQQRRGRALYGLDGQSKTFVTPSIKAPSSYDGASVTGSVLATPMKTTRHHRGSISTASATPLKSSIGPGSTPSQANRSLLPQPARQEASICPSPAARVLPYALLSTSMAFFLFGFQVHEKSILLPLLPLTLLMCAKGDSWGGGEARIDWEWAVLGNNVATFSLWPLLKKDQIAVPYALMLFFWNWVIGHRPFSELLAGRQTFIGWFGGLVHVGMVTLHALEAGLPYLLTPASLDRLTTRYPDLFPVLNVVLCTPVFGLIWLWALKRQLEIGFAVGLGGFGVLFGGRTGGGAGLGKAGLGQGGGVPRASPAPGGPAPSQKGSRVATAFS